MKLFIEKIACPSDEEVSTCELEYSKSLKSQKRRNEFLCGRALLRRVAKEEHGCPNIEVIINDKKPQLSGGEFHFSLSHSRQMLALVTSDKPVGVDVECIDPARNVEKIIKRFSPCVQKEFFALPKEQGLEYFFTLWTMYESFIKLQGKTLAAKDFDPITCGAQFSTQKIDKDYMLTTATY